MIKRIILEGVDGSGKSTVAKEIQEITQFDIVQGSSFEIAKEGRQYMFEYMLSLAKKDNIIMDRFYLSNLVYGKLFDKNTLNSLQVNAIEKELGNDSLTFILLPQRDFLISNLKKRGDEYINIEDVDPILERYEAISENLSSRIQNTRFIPLRYSSFLTEKDSLLNQIISYLNIYNT